MAEFRWSWLALPYATCTALIMAVAVAVALIRGDRVMRLGVIGAAVAAMPWSLAQALAACTEDPVVARQLLRLGQGPVAGVGPCLLLVLLGISGRLESNRWVARMAGIVGMVLLIVCWSTTWVVPDVQRVPAGMFYMQPGPLTGLHISQLLIWLGVGLVIARRAAPRGERKRLIRLWLGVLVLGAIGAVDTLLLYRIWGSYPIAWLPASIAAGLGLYVVFRTDLLRAQGFDRATASELAMFALGAGIVAALALTLGTTSPLPLVTLGAVTWTLVSGVAWAFARSRPVQVTGERELERFAARVASFDDEKHVAAPLAALWQQAIGINLRTVWWADGEGLTCADGTRWKLDAELLEWLVQYAQPLVLGDLATMRVGPMRSRLEALASASRATMIVPLVDREQLVGVVEADYDKALREGERGLIAESARVAARAITFVTLARAAAREREIAREIEVADALRLHASASREAELGRWAVAAEYRTAPRTTGAGWSAIELADGRLALLVTEAQAHGVAAALATAAITGAFAAATTGSAKVTLDQVLSSMGASSEGVMRGGEPVAAFLAILDGDAKRIEWACAGHPGAVLLGSIVQPISGGPRAERASLTEAQRGTSALSADTLLVVASSALRGDDDVRWHGKLQGQASASGRLAALLVEHALADGEPREDLLAVVVRPR